MMPNSFDNAYYTDEYGIYFDVMAGLSYEYYDIEIAAQILYNSLKTN